MNAIPLINNAPRPNINVGSIGSPAFNPVAAGAKLGGSIGGNVMRQNPASMPVNNETQLRQEVNTSIVALKREAFSLENLIAQAAQTLQDINKRLSELEGKQGDYVKKADATVESVGGDGKYISAISETDGKINATATDLGNMVPVNSVTSGNMHSVTSNAVASILNVATTETLCGFYDGEPLYGRLIVLQGTGMQAGVQKDFALPTDLNNKQIIKIEGYMVRENFKYNIPLGSYWSVWVANNTITLEETFTSAPQNYNFVIWIFYLK